MWNPPSVWISKEQKIAARTRKTRQFFVFLREAFQCGTLAHMVAQRQKRL